MDPPYTPYEDLPAKLQKEMQKLQKCKDRVIIQARRVVDVAVTEWQEADARAELTAAAPRLVRALTNDCEECPGAVREGDAEKAAYLQLSLHLTAEEEQTRSETIKAQTQAEGQLC